MIITLKKTIMILAFLPFAASVLASNSVTVATTTIPQGGSGTISVQLTNETPFTAFQMKLTLPEGISYQSAVGTTRFADQSLTANPSGSTVGLVALSTTVASFNESEGSLLDINVTADASLPIGTTLTAQLTEIEFTSTDPELGEVVFDDVTFDIVIGEPEDTHILLDENATIMPTSASNVDVRVRRTIHAGSWNTLVLPFNLTATQVKSIFGNDVQLAKFSGWESTAFDEKDNATAIQISFSTVEAIEANKPLIIKVSEDVAEFTVDGIDLVVDSDPSTYVGNNSRTRGYFTGSYIPKTLEDGSLFLNSNKFYYSTGVTRMLGYRAYFELPDIIGGENAPQLSMVIIDGGTTGVKHVEHIDSSFDGENINENWHNLQGVKLQKHPTDRGVYIRDRKKVFVK